MHVEGLLPVNVCLVTLLRLEQRSQYERFRSQHVQIVNKTSSFKTKLIRNMPRRAEFIAIHFDV